MDSIKELRGKTLSLCFSVRDTLLFFAFLLRMEFVNSMVALVKADSSWAPFTALKFKKLGDLFLRSN